MSFRFKRRESVAEGLRRIARKEFDAVEEALWSLPKGDKKEEFIHIARKRLKRLRALLQIFRKKMGVEWCAEESGRLKSAARQLGAARDASVRTTLFRNLLKEVCAPPQAASRRILSDWIKEENRALEVVTQTAAVNKLLENVTESRERFDQVSIPHAGWKAIADPLSRAYRRARKSYEAACEFAQDKDAKHTWRKRTKVLEYQLTLLRSTHNSVARLVTSLHSLTECLGCEHDLELLAAALRTEQAAFVISNEGLDLLSMIQLRLEHCCKRADKLGKRIFAVDSVSFIQDKKRQWQEWREK
jgi:CHAD domain-containing protein